MTLGHNTFCDFDQKIFIQTTFRIRKFYLYKSIIQKLLPLEDDRINIFSFTYVNK